MRKFYQLTRIDMNKLGTNDEQPIYIPIDLRKPNVLLGYFSSKRKILDRLIELEPKVLVNGKIGKPVANGYNSFGAWEAYMIYEPAVEHIKFYMIYELEAE